MSVDEEHIFIYNHNLGRENFPLEQEEEEKQNDAQAKKNTRHRATVMNNRNMETSAE